ncbi:MAG TPA: glutamate--tRNA ligase [Magnetospirillaceae bacterium]|jgi:glutamyl-tRNA synthetase
MSVRVRFAPSPTGRLHLGNARTAVVNWLFTRHAGGAFMLRIDDTDRERSRDEFTAAIKTDLAWLGIDWDEEAQQSVRLDQYADALDTLKAAGRAYACYETAEELDYKRKRQLARGKPPIYDRAALALSGDERKMFEAEGRKPHWRFKLDSGTVTWTDVVRGDVHYEADHLSDPVLVREDGVPLYTLTSVVDDIAFKMTHIIRGEDHVTNTVPQIQLFLALGGAVPAFAHLPLMVDADGKGLSKRLGSLSLEALRDDGLEPMAINSLLGRMGSSDAIEAAHDLKTLAAHFDLPAMGRASPRFDPIELDHLNARLLHGLSFAEAEPRLAALGLANTDEPFWLAVRGNLKRLRDAAAWWTVCRAPVAPTIEDAAFTAAAAGLLPPEPWGPETWRAWTKEVGAATGRKGRELFHPLRLALTGRGDGPELAALLPLIGRDRAAARLAGQTA